jgi:hypothetical protein
VHGTRSLAGYHHANVLDLTQIASDNWRDMLRPFPARFVRGTPYRHASELDDLEAPFFKSADLIRAFKSLN